MNNPYKPLSAKEICAEFEESRRCYDRGDYKDFDDALSEISRKYLLDKFVADIKAAEKSVEDGNYVTLEELHRTLQVKTF